MDDAIAYIFIVLAGIFCFLGGALNWNWFMNSRRAHFFVRVLGRGGARIFYMFLGTVIFIAGIVGMFSN